MTPAEIRAIQERAENYSTNEVEVRIDCQQLCGALLRAQVRYAEVRRILLESDCDCEG